MKLRSCKGWGAASIDKLFASIETRKKMKIPLNRMILSLGVPAVGTEAAKYLAGCFIEYEQLYMWVRRLRNLDADSFSPKIFENNEVGRLIIGVGNATSLSFARYFLDGGNFRSMERIFGDSVSPGIMGVAPVSVRLEQRTTDPKPGDVIGHGRSNITVELEL